MTQPMHSKRKHSDFSASAAYRWMNCPGSVELSKKAPPQIESAAAREGTEAHECMEFIVKRYSNLEGAKATALNKWPVDMVEHAINSAHKLFSLRPSPSAKLLVETRVSLKQVSSSLFGTLDYAWVEDWGTLVVADYKYGAGHAVMPIGFDGEPNPQLMYYAAALAHKYGYEFESVKLAIIQPRVWQSDEDPLTVGEVSVAALSEFETRVKKAVALAKQPNAPLKSGDHCQWCPAKSICPENSKVALAEAEVLFDIETGLEAAPEPFALTPQSLAKLLPAIEKLEIWIKAVKEHAQRMVEDGEKIKGYRLAPKRPQRVWSSDAEEKAKAKFGESIYEKKLLSPAQIDKRYGVVGKKFTAANSVAVSSGDKLVRDDGRGMIEVNGEVFD